MFPGLQVINITRGKENLAKVVSELLLTVLPQGFLALLDNYTQETFENSLAQQELKYDLVLHESFKPECQ